MTLLYGRDANGNQVPLLVDGSGIVQTSGGGTSWPGTSSQLTSGSGTAVNVGSGLSLAAGTLTAGVTTAFDCDFTLLSNQSITGSTVITDQSSRSLTFTPSFAGTASAAIVNGSGLGLTTASNVSRSIIRTSFNGFGRSTIGRGWRFWFRWQNYTPLGTTSSLFTGMQISMDSNVSTPAPIEHWRNNGPGSGLGNWYSNSAVGAGTYSIPFAPGGIDSYNVLVFEQQGGTFLGYVGTSMSGFPSMNSLRCLQTGVPSTTFYRNIDMTDGQVEMQFCNATDSTSRTMFITNVRVETWG